MPRELTIQSPKLGMYVRLKDMMLLGFCDAQNNWPTQPCWWPPGHALCFLGDDVVLEIKSGLDSWKQEP